jgi:hypothetical protein
LGVGFVDEQNMSSFFITSIRNYAINCEKKESNDDHHQYQYSQKQPKEEFVHKIAADGS